MVSINLTIENFWSFPFKRDKVLDVKIPTSWNDVSSDYLFPLFVLLPEAKNKLIKHAILSLFIDKKYIHYIPQSSLVVIFERIEQLAKEPITYPVMDYFEHRPTSIKFYLFGRKCTINLPFLKKRYYLPMPFMADLTMAEVALGLKKAIIYQNKGGGDAAIETLNEFVAVFCRPRPYSLLSFKESERPVLDTRKVDADAEELASLPLLTKLFVYEYVLASLDALKKAPKLKVLFPEPKKQDINSVSPKSKKKNDPNVWVDFIVSLSETGLLGSFSEIEKENFSTALYIAAKRKQDLMNQEFDRKSRPKR